MALDERLRLELDHAARPADPSGVYEELIRRRERRRLVHKVEAGALAVVVVLGSIGGVYALTRIFGRTEPPDVAGPSVTNGEIVFTAEEGEVVRVFAVSPDGSGLRQLSPEDGAAYRSPDVSPDGRTVVIAYEIPRFQSGMQVLATIPIEGGEATWLSQKPWLAFSPTWSPEGDRIAFVGSPSGPSGPLGLHVLDVNTLETTLVPGTENITVIEPTWSPDGSRIAFAGSPESPNSFPSDHPLDIYSIRVDGSELTNLTRTPNESESSPTWSWALDKIAFVRDTERASLFIIEAGGAGERRLTNGQVSPLNPVWSPDGAFVAFEDGVDTTIYTVRTDGTDLTAVPDTFGTGLAWQPLVESDSDQRTPIEEPTPTPSPSVGPDDELGLGFPICNVSSIDGRFVSPDSRSTIFVATRVGDTGGCPQPEDALNIVALDADRDGLAETSFGPIECTLDCRAFSAPDIDGDGTDELLVVQDGGAVVGLRLYDVKTTDGDSAIVPVVVAEPGDPQGGFEPGTQASFLLGGDAFELYTLRCGNIAERGGPGLIATSAESLPHDSPDAEWHAHETTLYLASDGLLSMTDVRDFTEPVTDDPNGPSFRSGETLCGSNLGPVVPIP